MQLIDLMRDLNRRLGVTFVFSTHDPRILDHADRVVHLCDGKIVEDGFFEDKALEEISDEKISAVGI